MEICFLTHEESVCRLIMERLEKFGFRCFLQNDWNVLYSELQAPQCRIDLLVCDFMLTSTCCFNLFEAIIEAGKKIPVIYYNDPSFGDLERVNHWISQNEIYYQSAFPSKYLDFLDKLNKTVCDPRIKRHISLLQPPVPLDGTEEENAGAEEKLNLVEFRLRNNLSPVLYRLFEFMYKNRTKDLTLKELEKALFSRRRSFFGHKSSVYSYISRLKTSLGAGETSNVRILRSSRGCYRLIVL
ncbi:MAG: hypothetical protein PUE30_04015 [Spirochaetia bacterium]|nr:hypothetical protein [Spirochaetia bacterium]